MNSAKLWNDSFEGLRGIPGFHVLLLLAMVVVSLLGIWQNIQQRFIYPQKFDALVEEYAAEYALEPELLYALIHTESAFLPDAVSEAGARGLTQIMPETFEWLQTKTDETLAVDALHEPRVSIRYGALFLHMLQEEFGETETVIAAYHAGRTRVNGWLDDREISPDGKTLAQIPTPKTAHYVQKVTRALAKYKVLY